MGAVPSFSVVAGCSMVALLLFLPLRLWHVAVCEKGLVPARIGRVAHGAGVVDCWRHAAAGLEFCARDVVVLRLRRQFAIVLHNWHASYWAGRG